MQANPTNWRAVLCQRGIDQCLRGDWKKGLEDLKTARRGSRTLDLPPRAYSYLGYAQAKVEGNVREGVKLCRFAVTQQFYESEHYFNLARAHLLADDRKEAIRAVERGLRIDHSAKELRQLRQEMGKRRKPVLSFLPRGSILNRLLGSVRHAVMR